MTSVNSGGRLDRLPIGPFHRRIMLLVGIGMFFDGFDIYLAGSVLGVVLKAGFSTLPQNAAFISATFVGMMAGSFLTGFFGDRYGRRFTYQANLLVFGLAAIGAAFAPNMTVLIVLCYARAAYNRGSRPEMMLFIAMAVLVVVAQGIFLIRGANFVRLWDVREYKELFIAIGLALFAWEATVRLRERYLKPRQMAAARNG